MATFSKEHCINYHRFPSQSARPIPVSRRFSYAFSQSRFTLLFGKVLKSDMRVDIYIDAESNSNQNRDLTLLCKQDTIWVRSILCVFVGQSSGCQTHIFYSDFKGHCLVSDNTYYFLKPRYSIEYIYIIYSSEYDVNTFSKKIKENFKRGHLWDFQNA